MTIKVFVEMAFVVVSIQLQSGLENLINGVDHDTICSS
jgi:hypothetical protein